MALTEFGKAVRKARIETGLTLLTMAEKLGTSPAFLSGMETGSKKIPKKWVDAIQSLFAEHYYEIPNLDLLANASNETISISGLPHQQQMLLGGFAKSEFTQEQLKAFADLLADIHKK
ncbi:helix-turn-helix domain-containing protein [Pantoea ananatis]|uniref:helix-turn-helix domain-containing protein n=1 Tax=Pantoea ananas TaxID=553 RepID=UPI001B309FF8|nr:helix-turn-helix transcriptional regulator [Pantoea ananatis]